MQPSPKQFSESPVAVSGRIVMAFCVILLLVFSTWLVDSLIARRLAATVFSQPGIPVAAINDSFQVKAGENILNFESGVVRYSLPGSQLSINFIGGRHVSPAAQLAQSGAALSESSAQGAPVVGKVMYENLWSGVDVVYEPRADGSLKAAYHIEPNRWIDRFFTGRFAVSNPANQIRLVFDAPVQLLQDGSLVIQAIGRQIVEETPTAWHVIAGKRVPVPVSFTQFGPNEIGFQVRNYRPAYPLVIDPLLTN